MTGTMYDSTMPGAIPADAQLVALYRNGRFAVTAQQGAMFPARLWIDVLGTDAATASVLDIETGDATPDTVRTWCPAREAAHPYSVDRLYCNLSTWPAVRAAVAELTGAQQARVRYWIANPTGAAHLVPGSDATQYLWTPGFDVSAYGPAWVTLT